MSWKGMNDAQKADVLSSAALAILIVTAIIVAIVGAALGAEYAPWPFKPFFAVLTIVIILGVGGVYRDRR